MKDRQIQLYSFKSMGNAKTKKNRIKKIFQRKIMKISAAFLFPYFFLAGGLYSPGKNNRETKIAEKNVCSPEKEVRCHFHFRAH